MLLDASVGVNRAAGDFTIAAGDAENNLGGDSTGG